MNFEQLSILHTGLIDNFMIVDENQTKNEVIGTDEIDEINKLIVDYGNQITIRYEHKNLKIYFFNANPSIISNHIFRLIKSKYPNEFFDLDEFASYEFILDLNNLIESNKYYNYCTICANQLELKGINKIQHCTNINCIQMYYQIPTDSRVIELFMRDEKVFEFLIKIFMEGLSHVKHSQTFKPLPFINGITNSSQLIEIVPTKLRTKPENLLIQIKQILLNYDNTYSTIFELKMDMQIEMEIFEKFGSLTYSIVKNAISNNYFLMSSRENDLGNSISFIHINYSTQVEEKFRTGNYLFHGSPIYSWYPIIKNGLKVMSGTSLQANGAAYGSGIYFSDSYNMSYGYSKSICYNIVGVFEIATDPNQYKRSTNIFVIPCDTVILLRTIIIAISEPPFKLINNYFIKDMAEQKKINKFNSVRLQYKRLISEHKKLSECEFIQSVEIVSDVKWNIFIIINGQIGQIEQIEQIELVQSIKPKTNDFIELEINFVNYPMIPPILKLSNTSIKNFPLKLVKNCNGVNEKKQIELDILNPTQWKFTYNLLRVIEDLKKCVEDTC